MSEIVERLRAGAWANAAVGAVDHAADLSTAADIIETVRKAADTIAAERALADDLAAVGRDLFTIFLEGGYAEDGDGPLLDRMHAVLARYDKARS